ncbi:MAG: HAD-IC family P-type ATPase, partial [Clostridia bacterium]|nr:HAD-IC family P-type ATPase [Clostridia bacterium]
MVKNFHSLSQKQVLEELKTSKTGISSAQAKSRLEKNGKNELAKSKKQSKLKMFFKQFYDFMIIILLFAAIVCAVVAFVEKQYEDLIDVGVILLIVILNAVIGFIQENKAENSLAQLKKFSQPHAKVMRDGKICDVDTSDVVVGDILMLEAGDVCCADVYLLESASLKCDESSLTGESVEVEKYVCENLAPDTSVGDRHNIVHSSSVVTYGRGFGVVVATGMNTELGKIATLLQHEEKQSTPIQQKLNSLGKIITIIVLAVAVAIFVVNIIIKPEPDYMQSLMVSIAIAVAAIPESLPAVITIIMALGVSSMSKKKAII